jgi:hypothetical protein
MESQYAVRDTPSLDERGDALEERFPAALGGESGVPRQVARHDDEALVGQSAEGVPVRWVVLAVDAGACDTAFREGLEQGAWIDDLRRGRVHEDDPGCMGELAPSDKAGRLQPRRVDGDVVRALEELLELDVLGAEFVRHVLLVVQPASAQGLDYPGSMAAAGDSITRAFNASVFPWTEAPWNSWSTGESGYVWSHYRRILAADPRILLRNVNDARSGAKMSDLQRQVGLVNLQRVEYVTVAEFRAQFEAAMRTLAAGSPNALVYVVSIPDVYRLWLILHENPDARWKWRLTGFCGSMLANPGSTAPADEARRQRVRTESSTTTPSSQTSARRMCCAGSTATRSSRTPSSLHTSPPATTSTPRGKGSACSRK